MKRAPKVAASLAGLALASCGLTCLLTCGLPAEAPSVYATERRLGEFQAGWLADGPNPSKVLTVVNRTWEPVVADVACYSNYREVLWVVEVPARDEVRGLIQLMNRDWGTPVCYVKSWRAEQ